MLHPGLASAAAQLYVLAPVVLNNQSWFLTHGQLLHLDSDYVLHVAYHLGQMIHVKYAF